MAERQHLHTRAMRRVNPSLRVLDHQAFVGQHRVALPQQITDTPECCDEPVGLGFAMLDILGCDNVKKQIAKSTAAQNRFGLGAQRAGRDHQRKPMRTIAHKFLSAGIQHISLCNHGLVHDRLARNQIRDMLLVRSVAILAQYRREAIAIVQSNQPRNVIIKTNLDPIVTQNLVERRKMQRLSINQRPIQIENDRANHAGVLSYMRSIFGRSREQNGVLAILRLLPGAGVTPAQGGAEPTAGSAFN